MEKVKVWQLEGLFSQAVGFKNSPTEVFTIQQISFANYCQNNFYGVGFLNEELIIKVKESYLSWQNKNIPSMKWVTEKYSNFGQVKTFSHSDDYTWVELDRYINHYIFTFTEEIGCKTHQDSLVEDYFNG